MCQRVSEDPGEMQFFCERIKSQEYNFAFRDRAMMKRFEQPEKARAASYKY
jgi:hypothetical protein